MSPQKPESVSESVDKGIPIPMDDFPKLLALTKRASCLFRTDLGFRELVWKLANICLCFVCMPIMISALH